MHKRWPFGVVGVVAGMVAVLAAVGLALGLGWLRWPGAAPAGPAGAGAAQAAAAASAPLLFRADEVVQVRAQALPQKLVFSGPLVAPNSAVLRAPVAGTLATLSVAEGDRVRAGQVLGQIDIAEMDSRLAERQAQQQAAQANLAQAERTHASNERLATQQFISSSALDASRAALDAARANLAAAQAGLDSTRATQRNGRLTAPISGIVARRQALPGEKLAAEQPVLSLVNLQPLELVGQVGTHEVALLQPGMAVQVQVEGLDTPVAARLARLAPSAEPGTRAIGVVVRLPNPDERLRAGQYALAEVLVADERPRLSLPLSAVGSTGGQSYVWLLSDGRLLRRAVTLGRRDPAGARVEVLDGLAEGATVLAGRFENLREGQPAQVQAGPGAAPGAPAGKAPAATPAPAPVATASR